MTTQKRILLVAINSRFNHVSLSIRAIESYVRKYAPHCAKKNNLSAKANSEQTSADVADNHFVLQTSYFTINQPLLEILQGIALAKPDAVFFSVYIWNVSLTMQVVTELKKILPDCLVAVGGPEVSYDAEQVLAKNTALDIVMAGEGERTVTELCEAIASPTVVPIGNIKGLYVRTKQGFLNTGKRPLTGVQKTLLRTHIQSLDVTNRHHRRRRNCFAQLRHRTLTLARHDNIKRRVFCKHLFRIIRNFRSAHRNKTVRKNFLQFGNHLHGKRHIPNVHGEEHRVRFCKRNALQYFQERLVYSE